MDVVSYEDRSDPESLRMERTEKDHTFIWRQRTRTDNWQCGIQLHNPSRNELFAYKYLYIFLDTWEFWRTNIFSKVFNNQNWKSECSDIFFALIFLWT
jgi:hypothetical protein